VSKITDTGESTSALLCPARCTSIHIYNEYKDKLAQYVYMAYALMNGSSMGLSCATTNNNDHRSTATRLATRLRSFTSNRKSLVDSASEAQLTVLIVRLPSSLG
jgi:hypothetical protein